DGEIWSGILWDLREKFIEKYDYEEGKAQVEQLVIDGMKFTKVNPSMLDARDAILAADLANEGGNQDLLWKVFACTGMGVPASTTDHNDANPVESFDLPDGTDCRGRVKLPWQSLREILGSILQDILGRWFNRI
ncbi:MAG: M36 family metallopeptidase, partial [Deltaproteobacteria bacterium]|nr:M36 family metallopeptidase [Deltaproteobacteria bacterium]